MNHPTEDELLLLAYDELPQDQAVHVESHIDTCEACQDKLAQVERARVGLDLATPARRRSPIVWATLALAAAAVLAAVMIPKAGTSRDPPERWTPTTTWSATAGYVTGGKAMLDIDAQLTRLERERYYGLPN
jgi:anti-sigma factor RsiW